MKSKNTLLVTGGAGFIGSHLCKQLLNLGHHVICVDNFYTGTQENLTRLQDHPHFHLIQQDICHPINLSPFSRLPPVTGIYHLACPASPIHYQRDPIQTTKTSVLGALNVLELAKNITIPVLFTSTSEVYGDPLVHPQPETYWGHVNSIGPRACYDEGKRCAESLFMDYHRQHQTNIRIARIFNTYGPHMDKQDGRVISNFIVQALNNQPITLYGDGHQTRAFCYVDDTVSALIMLMNHQHQPMPVNIGNPNELSMRAIANLIIKLTNSESTLHYQALPIDDPKQRCPDITLAKKQLNWEPTIDLITGLKKTIRYFQSQINY